MSFKNFSRIVSGCAALCAAAIVTGQEVRTKSGDVLAFTPPLSIPPRDLEQALGLVERALTEEAATP